MSGKGQGSKSEFRSASTTSLVNNLQTNERAERSLCTPLFTLAPVLCDRCLVLSLVSAWNTCDLILSPNLIAESYLIDLVIPGLNIKSPPLRLSTYSKLKSLRKMLNLYVSDWMVRVSVFFVPNSSQAAFRLVPHNHFMHNPSQEACAFIVQLKLSLNVQGREWSLSELRRDHQQRTTACASGVEVCGTTEEG